MRGNNEKKKQMIVADLMTSCVLKIVRTNYPALLHQSEKAHNFIFVLLDNFGIKTFSLQRTVLSGVLLGRVMSAESNMLGAGIRKKFCPSISKPNQLFPSIPPTSCSISYETLFHMVICLPFANPAAQISPLSH